MIVDDEPEMLLIVGTVLRRLGAYQTVEVSDPLQVPEVAARESPDAILMDVQMEGMDGPEVAARLAANPETRSIPIIFVTGSASPEESSRLIALGARGVIAKPIVPKALVGQVRSILEP